MLDRILDRLEEWIIATLIAAATLLTFVAVVHRYGASNAVVLSVWAKAHGLPWLASAANSIYLNLAAINLSWAQELATFMFIWICTTGWHEVEADEGEFGFGSSGIIWCCTKFLLVKSLGHCLTHMPPTQLNFQLP